MSSTRELLRKADIAVGDLQTNGGYLNPEQSNAFIRKLLIQPTLISQVRRVVMSSPVRNINKIQFATRILRKGVSATALSSGDRSKPTTEQIELRTSEVIAEVRIPYDVLEDNIERGNIGQMTETGGSPTSGGLRDTIMTLIAERAALDLEELAIHADTTHPTDDYLALQDGYLARFTTNIVDAAGAPISRAVLKNGMKAMPIQYRRNKGALRHFVSSDQEIEYRDTLNSRETAMGDSQYQSLAPVYGAGAPVESVGLMPSETGLLCNPLNLIFGIQRDIMFETDKIITERVYVIVVTARVALQVEEELAGVKYINVAA
jgi:hypothetical protein